MPRLGLNRKEANEFIVYWLPQMEQNDWNVVLFQNECYEACALLKVSPEPDSLIRVFMAWYATDEHVDIPESIINTPVRIGFTVVEWGGSEIQ